MTFPIKYVTQLLILDKQKCLKYYNTRVLDKDRKSRDGIPLNNYQLDIFVIIL